MRTVPLGAVLVLASGCSDDGDGLDGVARADAREQPGEVLVSPPFREPYTCSEHPAGQLTAPGDALGADCLVIGEVGGNTFPRAYAGDGSQNEDWYGWNAEMHAPFDGKVVGTRLNATTNRPGVLGESPSTSLTFERSDGVRVIYAHLQGVAVVAGEEVKAGQIVARVGNNGMAFMPHVHIGAWKAEEPLQIRFDLNAMARLRGIAG